MIPKDDISSDSKENPEMKKLLVAALGLGIALGTVSFAAQQDTSSTDTGKASKKKHKKNKKSDTTSSSDKKM
jgi:hypothetical protein